MLHMGFWILKRLILYIILLYILWNINIINQNKVSTPITVIFNTFETKLYPVDFPKFCIV